MRSPKRASAKDCFLPSYSRMSLSTLGRRRVYVNAISLPQTCRSNWHAIQPTTNRVMAGHHQPLNVDADLLQNSHMRECQFATLKTPA